LRRINLTIEDGELMVLVGPSGCGKSTLLRIVAGLELLTGGQVWVGDRLVNTLPPKDRNTAMVFQSYALYPHLSVYDNLAFGLRRLHQDDLLTGSRPAWLDRTLVATSRKLPKSLHYLSPAEAAIADKVHRAARTLQIEPLLDRLPKALSGGQKQRVALGRAIVREPDVFLMDEPLSNLDAKLRAETRTQIVALQRQLGTTTIYVTHDQVEAMTMGDRIAVMNAGQIQQVAPPLELYHRPANRFVAEFIGSPPMNFLPVEVQRPTLLCNGQFRMTLPEIWTDVLASYAGQPLWLGIRPEHWQVAVPAPKNLRVQVAWIESLGHETYAGVTPLEAHMTLGNLTTATLPQVRTSGDFVVNVGDELWLAAAGDRLHLFDPATGVALRP
jgi:multiple sugar transport system ATP-binding protein